MGEVKSEKAEAEPKEEVDRYKVLDQKKIVELQMVCGRHAGEWIEREDLLTMHEELKKTGDEPKIDRFIENDPRIVIDLNNLREMAANHLIPELSIDSKRSVIINAYLGRFLRSQAGKANEYRHGVGLGRIFESNVRSASQPAEPAKPIADEKNVISFEQAREAHSHHPTDPKPTEPVQPTPAPREPEDEDFKVA